MIRLRRVILLAATQISLLSFGITHLQQLEYARNRYEVEGTAYQRSNLKKPTPLHAFAALGQLEKIKVLIKEKLT